MLWSGTLVFNLKSVVPDLKNKVFLPTYGKSCTNGTHSNAKCTHQNILIKDFASSRSRGLIVNRCM